MAEIDRPESVTVERARLGNLTVDDLKRELADAIGVTVNALIRAALIVQELERRGVDLSELRLSLLPTLRLIGSGQLAPEAAVRFLGRPQLMGVVSRLPVADQRSLGDGAPVALAVRHPDGAIGHRLGDPLHLQRDQIHQVFGPDRIRPIEEQIVVVEAKRATAAAPRPKPDASRLVQADRRNNCLKVRHTRIPVADFLAAAAELRGDASEDEPEDAETKTAVLRVTDAEHRRLKVLAAESGTTVTTLIRRALIAYGLI